MSVSIAIIGAGQRGKDVYATFLKQYYPEVKIVAVAEPDQTKCTEMLKTYGVPVERVYRSWELMLAEPKFCDAVIIATPDHLHFAPAKVAIEKGYHLLLEKPIANHLEECVALAEMARGRDQIFMVGHVLRYTPFFTKLKQLLEDHVIGELMTVQHTESIGYFHFAHSFVRGIWQSEQTSSPLILAKSCHDLDILLWLINADCRKLTSYGNLRHFKADQAPIGAGERCQACSVERDCPYSALKIYPPYLGEWPTTVVCAEQTPEALDVALRTGDYGKCVYASNNDVVDNQVTIFEFENDVTATFNLSAFTNEITRTSKFMGTLGEIRTDLLQNEIEVRLFGSDEKQVIYPESIAGGHGGGDGGLIADFVALLTGQEGLALTSINQAVQSHVLAFAAEESRRKDRSVHIKDFYKSVLGQ